MTRCHVGLVLVTHSVKIAEGLAEVAAQMAPDVPILAAGGCLDGRIGTSYERVATAVQEVLTVEGMDSVVILTDLGSAALTAEAVLEGLDDPRASWVDAPLVEGAVAAAVAAQTGGSCEAVRRSIWQVCAAYGQLAEAHLAGLRPGDVPAPPGPSRTTSAAAGAPAARGVPGGRAAGRSRTLHLVNRLGLHARPAALLARAAGDFEAEVRVNGVPATSVLELMSLGLEVGAELRLAATGPEAGAALDAIEELVAARFGEQ